MKKIPLVTLSPYSIRKTKRKQKKKEKKKEKE
jgi:hypothetical protein